MRLPSAWLRHTITVEPYLGANATGPVYGPPRDVRCAVEFGRSTVRAPDGRTVIAGTTIRCQLDESGITPEARITYRGTRVEVIAVKRWDGGGLPVPNHLEISGQ